MDHSIDPRESEARLISSALDESRMMRLISEGISPEGMFVWGDVWAFVLEHYNKYGKVPSLQTVVLANPDFPTFGTDNIDFDFLVDIAKINSQKKKTKNALAHAIDLVEDDPAKAAAYLIASIPAISREIIKKGVYSDGDVQSRYNRYMEIQREIRSGKGVGLRTGIKPLDEQLIGWVPGDCAMIVGPPEVGKSWFLLKTSIEAYMAGAKILYLSLEMSKEEIDARFDTLLGKKFGYIFRNDELVTGRLRNEEEYIEFLERIGGRNNWVTADLSDEVQLTVPKVEAMVHEYAPNVVAIDPIMLMTASSGQMAVGWTDLLDVIYSLKFLARRRQIVILIVGPSVGETFDSYEPATLSELGLSRNMGYAPDIIVSLAKAPEEKQRNLGIAKKRKGRGVKEVFTISFDPNIGNVG